MKRFYLFVVLCLVFTAPAMGNNVLTFSDGGGGTRASSTVGEVGSGNDIPASVIEYILSQAAPQFYVSVRWLNIQYNRGHVTIVEIGQNLYSVTYGGITIQILIESGISNDGGPIKARISERH
jgi:hypothetical protein